MNKLIKNGKVAVLYSPGFGAGWSTWNAEYPEILFDPEIAQLVIDKRPTSAIIAYAESKYPNGYFGGARDLTVEWVQEGTSFYIHEYDGSEDVRYGDSDPWVTA